VLRRCVHAEAVMGTVVSIDVRTDVAATRVRAGLEAAVRCLHEVDATFSPYLPGSVVSRVGRGELSLAACPPDVREVAERCVAAERVTGGSFSASYRGGGTWDPTGLVKGWAAERVSRLLHAEGLGRHCVNAAGDVRLGDPPDPERPWRVGITDPRDAQRLLTTVSGSAMAVATSGTVERGPHVLDPGTGEPPTGLLQVTVVGPDLTEADAYATAVLAAGGDGVALAGRLAVGGWQALLVRADGSVCCTRGWQSDRTVEDVVA